MSGYALHLQPYPGYAEKPTSDCDFGSSPNVVYYLAKIHRSRYEKLPLSITMDNYFSSFPVFEEVKNNCDIICTGTVRKNQVPKNSIRYKKIEKSPRGAFSAHFEENSAIEVVDWNDNNVVTVMSNRVSSSPTASAQRYSSASKSKISVTCPNSVKFYNATMGGVDRLYGNLQSCRIAIREKKGIFLLFILVGCLCEQHMDYSSPVK